MNDDRLLTVAEAAALLRCSRSRVYELLKDGTLVRGPKFGRHTVIPESSVKAALLPVEQPVPLPAKPRRRRSRSNFNEEIDAVIARARARARVTRK
jgi:excisionase family DNA binding protein